MTPSDCSVRYAALRAIAASVDFNKAMRGLRRTLRSCLNCEFEAACHFRQQINEQVDAAISEITDEWQLARTP